MPTCFNRLGRARHRGLVAAFWMWCPRRSITLPPTVAVSPWLPGDSTAPEISRPMLVAARRAIIAPLRVAFGYLLGLGAAVGTLAAIVQWGWQEPVVPGAARHGDQYGRRPQHRRRLRAVALTANRPGTRHGTRGGRGDQRGWLPRWLGQLVPASEGAELKRPVGRRAPRAHDPSLVKEG